MLTWTDNSTNEEGFRIDRSTDGGAVWELVNTTVYLGSNTANDVNRQSEQAVCYRVVAFNVTGDAPPSNTACTTPPAGPTNLTLTAVKAETFELTWTDNSAVEDRYQVVLVRWRNSSGPICICTGGCNADIYPEESLLAELPPDSTAYRPVESIDCGTQFYVVATKDGGRSDAPWVP